MDSHEKLGNLLSQYLASPEPEEPIPANVSEAFRTLSLTEYASKENVDKTYQDKLDELNAEKANSSGSTFSRAYLEQQKKELDSAYKLITKWLTRNDSAR